jgi:hypothetical protein
MPLMGGEAEGMASGGKEEANQAGISFSDPFVFSNGH